MEFKSVEVRVKSVGVEFEILLTCLGCGPVWKGWHVHPEVFLGILEEHPGFLTMHPDFSKE